MKVFAQDIRDGMTVEDADTGVRIFVTAVADEGIIVIDGEASVDLVDGPDYGFEQARWVVTAGFDPLDIVKVVDLGALR